MTTTAGPAPVPTGPRAAGIHWDLSPLVSGAEEARRRLEAGLDRAREFERYRGTLATIEPPGSPRRSRSSRDRQRALAVSSYVHLRESVDVTSQENKDLSAAVDRALVEAANALRFFDLEWIARAGGARTGAVRLPRGIARPPLPVALRRFAPHTLSEPEERMLAERGPAAVSAWQTLFGRITSTLEVPFDAGG